MGQRFQDQIPQIVSEYLSLIFLGDLDGNSEALKKYPNGGMDECLGGRAQWWLGLGLVLLFTASITGKKERFG